MELGQTKQAVTGSNVVLDFGGLFSDPPKSRRQPERARESLERKEPDNSSLKEATANKGNSGSPKAISETDIPAKKLLIKTIREDEDHQRNLEMFGYYQDNIKRSEMLRAEILHGLKEGSSAVELLLKAIECIGKMTNDCVFEKQAAADATRRFKNNG